MIVREATDTDLKPAARFMHERLSALGVSNVTPTPNRIRSLQSRGYRLLLAFDPDWRSKDIAAFLAVRPCETHLGGGYTVLEWAAHADYPDAFLALDAVCLFGVNIAVSEGRHYIKGDGPLFHTFAYGASVGMETTVEGRDGATKEPSYWRNTGDARDIMVAILKRRPQWRISL